MPVCRKCTALAMLISTDNRSDQLKTLPGLSSPEHAIVTLKFSSQYKQLHRLSGGDQRFTFNFLMYIIFQFEGLNASWKTAPYSSLFHSLNGFQSNLNIPRCYYPLSTGTTWY